MKQIHGRPAHPQTQGKIERYHESLKNLTPADVYYGRTDDILKIRQQIKQETLLKRKNDYYQQKLIHPEKIILENFEPKKL